MITGADRIIADMLDKGMNEYLDRVWNAVDGDGMAYVRFRHEGRLTSVQYRKWTHKGRHPLPAPVDVEDELNIQQVAAAMSRRDREGREFGGFHYPDGLDTPEQAVRAFLEHIEKDYTTDRLPRFYRIVWRDRPKLDCFGFFASKWLVEARCAFIPAGAEIVPYSVAEAVELETYS